MSVSFYSPTNTLQPTILLCHNNAVQVLKIHSRKLQIPIKQSQTKKMHNYHALLRYRLHLLEPIRKVLYYFLQVGTRLLN